MLRTVGLGVAGLSVAGNASAGEGRFIVGATSPAAARAANNRARTVTRVIDLGRVRAVAGVYSQRAVEELARRRDVSYVEPDAPVQAIGELKWGVDRIDAEVAHAEGITGNESKQAHVAIIDTGIDLDHPDLEANIAPSGQHIAYVDCRGGGCQESYDDDHGHGTHCAGIAAAVRGNGGVVGVGPDVVLHAVKVLDKNGRGWSSDVAAGIQWVADNAGSWGPTVASLSLGGGSTQTKKEACRNAYEAGVLVVAAAGNSGPCDDDPDGCIGYPAAYNTVVAVTATRKSDDAVTNWSSTGPEAELAAPGAAITSTVPGGGYDIWSGTSMACPHVSGAGALLMANGYANADTIAFKDGGSSLNLTDAAYDSPGGARGRLRDTAEDLGPGGWDRYYGYGLLDVANAFGLDSSDDLGGSSDGGSSLAVTTDGATAGETSATLDGTVSGLADGESATAYFEWGTTSGALDQQTADQTVGNQSFSAELSGLTADTTYYFRAVATDGSSTVYGEELSFTTTGSGGSDTTDPSGTIDGVTEVSTNNPHAEYAVDWTASDDVDLKEVTVELRRNGSAVVDSVPTAVSGTGPVSGTTEVSEKFGSRDGHTYEVRLVVTDAADNVYQSTWQSTTP